MPQPPRQAPPPPGSTAVPTAAMVPLGAASAATVAPALASAAAGALSAAAAAALAKKLTAAMLDFSSERFPAALTFVGGLLAQEFAGQPGIDLSEALVKERQYERTFRDKMRLRLERDLPDVLSIDDPAARMERLNKVFERERRYTALREEAMLLRTYGNVEAQMLEVVSPQGAYWKLDESVREHTLDCIAMGEKFWPWGVLKVWHPPRHAGCPCRLYGLDEAVAMGFMLPDQIADPKDATERFRSIRARFEGLEEALVELAADGIDLEEVQVTRRGSQRVLRWAKGLAKGGEFRPVRGGDPGERTGLRLLSPRTLATNERERWAWVRGVYSRIPEAREWRRERGGHIYHSPAGSTNVYRDGKLISAPGVDGPPEERRRRSVGVAERSEASGLAARMDSAREARRAAAAAEIRAALRSGRRAPIERGDDATKLLALRDEGFTLVALAPKSRGTTYVFARGDQRLTAEFDGRMVVEVDWKPAPPPREPAELGRPPVTWQEFVSDGFAWADEVAQRFGAKVTVADIRFDTSLSDHAGVHHWGGEVDLGRDTKPSIEAAAAARQEGRPLTDHEARGVWGAYWALAHEAAGHGVNPISPEDFAGADKMLEEALAEEMAHVLAVERLTEQGQADVLAWRQAHPDAPEVRGGYRPQRAALGSLLDDLGLTSYEQRRMMLERLAFVTPPAERIAELAETLAQARGEGASDNTLTEVSRRLLDADGDGQALASVAQSPGAAQVGANYGRFVGGVLSKDGTELRLPDGGLRRLETLPLMAGAEGLSDGSALTVYRAGQEPTDTLTYADGSPKNFRYIDSAERGKLILRAFTGKGSPGVPVDDEQVARVEGELRAMKGWMYVDGVPVKRRAGEHFGVGWPEDARVLSDVAGSRAAAEVALVRAQSPAPWGAPSAALGSTDPRLERLEWLGWDPPTAQRAALRSWLDEIEADGQFPYVAEVSPEGWVRIESDAGDAWMTPTGKITVAGPPSAPRSPGATGSLFDDLGDDDKDPTVWLKHMPKLFSSPASKPPKKTKPKKPVKRFIGGLKGKAAKSSGPIPNYNGTRLEVGNSAGGSNGAVWAFDKAGNRWLVKTYRGNQDRVATELLANRIYAEMGAKVAEAGTITVSKRPALTYPALDGEVRQYVFKQGVPSEEVGAHFMVDALLANWDFVGMTDDNIMWDPDGKPFRVDQGGTFEFRAQGQAKPYGPVPTEVWTMLRKGQAKRASAVTEDEMREQGAQVAKVLTDERVDELVDAAPFKDGEMRERIRENLKARIAWMGAFARGEVDLPQPLEGEKAREHLAGLKPKGKPFPEEDQAISAYAGGLYADVREHLRSGAKREDADPEVRRTIDGLDSLLREVAPTTDEDMVAYLGVDVPPGGGGDLIGKTLREKSYLHATTSEAEARAFDTVLRLTLPSGTHLLFTDTFADAGDGDAPEIIIARGALLRVTGTREVDGRTYLEATVSTQAAQKPLKTGGGPKPKKTPAGKPAKGVFADNPFEWGQKVKDEDGTLYSVVIPTTLDGQVMVEPVGPGGKKGMGMHKRPPEGLSPAD